MTWFGAVLDWLACVDAGAARPKVTAPRTLPCGLGGVLDWLACVDAMVPAAVCIVARAGKVLAVTRPGDGPVALPGGSVDPGETDAEAALRELQEETGCRASEPRKVYEAVLRGRRVSVFAAVAPENYEITEEPERALGVHVMWLDPWELTAPTAYEPGFAAAALAAFRRGPARAVDRGRSGLEPQVVAQG